MPLETHTVTLRTEYPGGEPLDGIWSTSVYAFPPLVKDTLDHNVIAGKDPEITEDGLAVLVLEETGQPNLIPLDFRWQISFVSRDRNVRLGPYVFELHDDITLDEIAESSGVPVTSSILEQAVAAADAADASALQTALDRAAIEALGLTNDGIIASRISDPVSETRDTLDSLYVPRGGAIADLPVPWYLAHRGLSMSMPENTMEAMRAAVEGGADGLETDIQTLADGAAVLMHDTTVDRTTDGTGPVSALTVLDWKRLNASDGHVWTLTTRPPFLSEFVNEFGGSVALVLEPKDTTSIPQIAAHVRRLGLEGNTIVYSLDLTLVAAASAAGLLTGWYKASSPTGAEVDAAIAAGADWILGNLGWNTDADITLMVGKGKPVMVFGVERRTDRDRMVSLGVKSLGTNEVSYLRRTTAIRTTDSWRNGVRGHGLTQGASANPPILTGGALRVNAASLEYWLVGEVSPVANAAGTYTIDCDVAFNTLPSDLTRWVAVPCAMVSDALYLNQANFLKNGYEPLLRANGQLQLWRMTAPNTPLQLGVTCATAPLVAGAFAHLKTIITPTTVTLVRTDAPVATLSAGLAAGVAVTSLPINALAVALASGAKVQLPTGQIATLSAGAAAGATALAVTSITPSSAVASGASLLGAIQATDSTYRGGYVFVGKTGTGVADFKNLAVT